MSTLPDPLSALARRVRDELGSLFDLSKPVAAGFSPQCIDVIGGLLAGQGGPRCVMPVDRYATVLAQPRADRQILIFDFDEYDLQRPFTLQISLEALLNSSLDDLRKNLKEPGRQFAEPVIAAIRELGVGSKSREKVSGMNVAVHRQKCVDRAPASSVAATVTVAQLTHGASVAEELLIASSLNAAAMFASTPAARLEVRASFRPGAQWCISPEDAEAPVTRVQMPGGAGVFAIPIEMRIDPQVLAKVEIAARMAHRLVLEKMRAFGTEAGRALISDPMGGQIGRLAMSDYKRFFRGSLPETMSGEEFIARYGIQEIDIDPKVNYAPQLVADHLVIEAHRVREFVRHLDEACVETDAFKHKLAIDKAGHLLYASHKSARDNCAVGDDEADRIVDAVRANEPIGFFGARLGAVPSAHAIAALCRTDAMSLLCDIAHPKDPSIDAILPNASLSAFAKGLMIADLFA